MPSIRNGDRLISAGRPVPQEARQAPTAYPRCPDCDVAGLGDAAMLEHRWRRHTAAEYQRVFGRTILNGDPVRWNELRRADLEAAIEQRHRSLTAVHAW